MNTLKSEFRISRLSIISFIIFLSTFIVFSFRYYKVESFLRTEYLYVLSAYLIVYLVFFLYSTLFTVDLFEPLPLITIIYLLFFSISPLLDISTNNIYFFEHNVTGGTKKATLYFLIGYISLVYGYYLQAKFNWKFILFNKAKHATQSRVIIFNLLIWLFGLGSSIVLLINSGQNFLYIFSFGLLGSVQTLPNVAEVGFLAMFSYMMVVPWMYIITNTNSKLLKVVITLVTFSVFFVRGYRFILFIMIIAPLVFYYLIKGRRPSLITGFITGGLLTILVGIVGFVRGDVRKGKAVNWSEFGIDEIWYGLESNFGIYKAFYRMVEVIPDSFSFTLGSQISYTFVLMIPRFFWPSKPDTPLREVIRSVLGDYAVLAGTAWPNIGEYYSEFGLIGVIIGMFLLGFLSKKSFNFANLKNASIHRIMVYSILFPLFLQIVIRGYTPSIFWMMVFFLIPIIANYKMGQTSYYDGIFKSKYLER